MRSVMIFAAAALFAAAPLQAAVVTSFNDNFDGRATGALPLNGAAPKWTYTTVTGASYSVVADPAPTGASDHALLVVRTGTGGYVYTNTSPDVSLSHQTVTHVSFDLNQPDEYNSVGNSGMFITLDTGSGSNAAGAVQISGSGALSYSTYNGTVRTSHSPSPAKTVTQGTWTHFDFQIQYDVAQTSYTYSLTVGGSEIASGQLAPNLANGNDLRLFLSPQGTNSATYFDNVLITTEPVPEPASGALLLATIGGLLLRRPRSARSPK